MENTEKNNHDNYEIMYDKNGYSRGEGIPIFKDVFDFYNIIEDFYLTEIINKGKDLSELGKYLDYNFAYNSYQCVDFLHYLYFVYEPYFSQDLTDYRVSWIEDFHPIHQYKIAEYIKNWINGEIKLIGKNSLNDIAKGSIIGEMYATIPTQSSPTTSPEAEDKDKIIDFVKDINPCTEFDKLFGNDIKGKIEIWNYMIDLKMIDVNGNYLMGSSISFIKSFVVIMKKYFKMPNQSDTKLVSVLTLKIFGKLKRIHTSKIEDERQIEGFLNGN